MRFGGLVAVNDLNFTAHQRDITAIIGPNGAGKTTVFNCLTGFYRPTVGRAHLPRHQRAGAARAEGRVHDPARRPRADVPEHPPVRQDEHAREPDRRPAQPADEGLRASAFSACSASARYRAAEREAIELAKFWLDRTGLTAKADWNAGALPYGDQRKLEIARAMCTRPRLLCLDEPAAGLNPRETADLSQLLKSIRDEQDVSILLIEHDMGMVMGISDHIVVLDYGRRSPTARPRRSAPTRR